MSPKGDIHGLSGGRLLATSEVKGLKVDPALKVKICNGKFTSKIYVKQIINDRIWT